MDWDIWWLAYLALGAFTGFMAGLMGIGGGGILVPMLNTLFTLQGFPAANNVHMALGTSMAAIVLTSLSSARAHHAHGAVAWRTVFTIAPGIVLGAFAGTFLAARLPDIPLTAFFACFMLYVSWQMIKNTKPAPSRHLPGTAGLSAVGLGIGTLSALVSIGGGTVTIPFLIWCNVPPKTAIGTSAAVGIFIAVSGTLGYIFNGQAAHGMPAGAMGFIFLPALVLVSLASIWTAPLGAKLSHRLPVATLKKVFAVILILLSAKMLYTVCTA